MKPVNTISSIRCDFGALGYSALVYKGWNDGPIERKTWWYVRDANGIVLDAIIVPADEVI